MVDSVIDASLDCSEGTQSYFAYVLCKMSQTAGNMDPVRKLLLSPNLCERAADCVLRWANGNGDVYTLSKAMTWMSNKGRQVSINDLIKQAETRAAAEATLKFLQDEKRRMQREREVYELYEQEKPTPAPSSFFQTNEERRKAVGREKAHCL